MTTTSSKKEYVMEDFEATTVAQDAIRLDLYNDQIDGPTRGRYTEIISVSQAMALVILLVTAIEKCEVIQSQAAPKRSRKAA